MHRTRSAAKASLARAIGGVIFMRRPSRRSTASASSGTSSGRSRSDGTRNLDHVDAVKQVLAELCPRPPAERGSCGWPITIARRCLPRRCSPMGRTAFSWMTRSSFTCMCSGRSAISSRNKRAALRRLDQSLLVADRAGEAAALVPEELAFHQLRWNRAAIDRYERAIAARAGFVNEFRDQFLAGPGFPENVHGSLAACDARDHFAQVLHGGRGCRAGAGRTRWCRRLRSRPTA